MGMYKGYSPLKTCRHCKKTVEIKGVTKQRFITCEKCERLIAKGELKVDSQYRKSVCRDFWDINGTAVYMY